MSRRPQCAALAIHSLPRHFPRSLHLWLRHTIPGRDAAAASSLSPPAVTSFRKATHWTGASFVGLSACPPPRASARPGAHLAMREAGHQLTRTPRTCGYLPLFPPPLPHSGPRFCGVQATPPSPASQGSAPSTSPLALTPVRPPSSRPAAPSHGPTAALHPGPTPSSWPRPLMPRLHPVPRPGEALRGLDHTPSMASRPHTGPGL